MAIETLYIQPHSDDAAMSSYFTIKSGYFGSSQGLLTVFSKSNWHEPGLLSESASVSEITRTRLREDCEFAKKAGVPLFLWPYRDCLLRNKKTIFNPLNPLPSKLVQRITKDLINFVDKKKVKNIIVPFPRGEKQHLDHRIVFCATLQCKKVRNYINVYFVDDMPYGYVSSCRNEGLRLYQSFAVNLEEKLGVLAIYKSQISDYFKKSVTAITKRNKFRERILCPKN
jgi:hypothetical protein